MLFASKSSTSLLKARVLQLGSWKSHILMFLSEEVYSSYSLLIEA